MAGDVELNCLQELIVEVALKAFLPTLFAKNDMLQWLVLDGEGLSGSLQLLTPSTPITRGRAAGFVPRSSA
jgi:hypothetical protein